MNPLKSVVTRKASEVEPHKLREQLQHLGPIFVKAGHYLALRPDILSDEYCYELLQLPDTAPARPWEEIESVLRDELGDRLDTAFQSIDHRPHSSGVLSQRHCARTADGADVVIKVLAPGTRERVERDLRRGRALARALDASGISLGIAPRQLADEISAWLTQQLDYRRELENLERWERLASASDIDAAPRPLPDLCSERVLTTEFMGGTPMLELLLASTASDGEERWRRLAEQGIDRDAVSENLIASTLRQIFRDHFFNGQMHPGNLIVLPGNVIGFIDFGLCQELDPQFHEPSIRVLAAIYRSDTDQLYRSISEILVPGERANISAFRAEFIRATRDRPGTGAPDGSSGRDASIGAKPLALAMSGVMRAARHHDLTLPVGILPMIRSLLAASTIADRLCVDADLLGVGRRFFTRLEAREALRLLSPEQVQASLYTVLSLARDAPGQVQQLLADLAEDRFAMNVYLTETPRALRDSNRRARLISVAILSVGLSVLLAGHALPSFLGLSLAVPTAAMLVFLYVWMVMQWRRLR